MNETTQKLISFAADLAIFLAGLGVSLGILYNLIELVKQYFLAIM